MARLIFEGLTTVQAINLARWYEHFGELDSSCFFEEKGLGELPLANYRRKGGSKEILPDGDVVLYCYTSDVVLELVIEERIRNLLDPKDI